MDNLDSLKHAFPGGEEEQSLRLLYKWLRYEGLTVIGGAGIFWLPYGLVLKAFVIFAVLFTPYMLWHLARAKWYKSIILFLVVVLMPLGAVQFTEPDASITYFLLSIGALVFFYVYTWILRHVIGERLTELEAVRKLEYERKKRAILDE